MIKTRIKVFISNKGVLLEDKVNKELEELEKEGFLIKDITTNISFSGTTGYQCMATIIYEEIIEDGWKINIDTDALADLDFGEFGPALSKQ